MLLSISLEITLSISIKKVSATINSSKIRKFAEFYDEFYPRAKVNRQLMTALQKAEIRLKENFQDIGVFEEIRNELKSQNESRLMRKVSLHSEHEEYKVP